MSRKAVKSLVADYKAGRPFTAHQLEISTEDCEIWVRFKIDPQRFLPKIFEGDWAHTKQHPEAGVIRVVRVMEGTDGITRVIGRQGDRIFASPWLN